MADAVTASMLPGSSKRRERSVEMDWFGPGMMVLMGPGEMEMNPEKRPEQNPDGGCGWRRWRAALVGVSTLAGFDRHRRWWATKQRSAARHPATAGREGARGYAAFPVDWVHLSSHFTWGVREKDSR